MGVDWCAGECCIRVSIVEVGLLPCEEFRDRSRWDATVMQSFRAKCVRLEESPRQSLDCMRMGRDWNYIAHWHECILARACSRVHDRVQFLAHCHALV